jgi:nicotinate phosphoribosyltransferase
MTLDMDLYQLTMAQGWWQSAKEQSKASFYMHFRENPFRGGYTVICGLAQAAEFLEGFHFSCEDIEYLASIGAGPGGGLFNPAFLDYLAGLTLDLDVDAPREGTIVFPNEPVLRVSGPLVQCQLVETALLNIIGFQSLIATKAARVCFAASGAPVAEFGLRRAQGPAGGLYASRAAIIGGCASTSNVAAGKQFGVPVSGTHAHSWVMAFDSELEAFRAFALEFPQNCVLLVDTYETLEGVRNAITVAHEMEQRNERLHGIRIDSGDLAWLSMNARRMLDEAGLDYVRIVASNDLDEHTITSLVREQKAAIDSWGVGTRLATAYDQPALGCVYKMSAIKADGEGAWLPRMKISEQAQKSTLPGILAVRRYVNAAGMMIGDMVYDATQPPSQDRIIDPADDLRQKSLADATWTELLQPLLRSGSCVDPLPAVQESQDAMRSSFAQLDATNKRLLNPHTYPVGLSRELHESRDRLIRQSRNLA